LLAIREARTRKSAFFTDDPILIVLRISVLEVILSAAKS